MKKIKLTKGKYALVDDEDFEKLNKYNYKTKSFNRNGRYVYYAERRLFINLKWRYIGIHRDVIGLVFGDGIEIDHKNRNGLDNRKINLRVCTRSQNVINSPKLNRNTSGYKGVVWDNDRKKWRAAIRFHGKLYNLRRYETKKEAAREYNRAAIKYFGEFAYLNKV